MQYNGNDVSGPTTTDNARNNAGAHGWIFTSKQQQFLIFYFF